MMEAMEADTNGNGVLFQYKVIFPGTLANKDSINGLLSDGTKPLPEPMMTDNHWGLDSLTIRL